MNRYDNITVEDARKLYERFMKEEVLSKYNFPTKPSSDGYYHIYIKDETKQSGRRAIKDKDLEKLKEKVYDAIYITKTFQACFEEWQEEKVKYIKDPEKLLSVENTLARDRSEYRRFFDGSDFENTCVDEISEEDIYNYTFNILNKINFKIKTLNSYKSILLGVFKYAYTSKLILINPMDRVDFARFKHMLEKDTALSDRVHSDDTIADMLDYTRKYQLDHPDFMPAYALEVQILTGLRRGEVPPLTWDDILEDRILIRKEQIGHKIVHHTKNYKDRFFPITEDINLLLNKIKNKNNKTYLFPSVSDPTKPIGNNAVYKFYYYKVCKDLGIDTSRDKIKGTHAFRRTGISNIINNGYSFEIAATLYGNSPRTAEKNYFVGLSLETAKSAILGNQR